MKRKKIELDETILMTNEEMSNIKGGTERTRTRIRFEDGTKLRQKHISAE